MFCKINKIHLAILEERHMWQSMTRKRRSTNKRIKFALYVNVKISRLRGDSQRNHLTWRPKAKNVVTHLSWITIMSKAVRMYFNVCMAGNEKINYPLYEANKFCNSVQIYCLYQLKIMLLNIWLIIKQRVAIINDLLAIFMKFKSVKCYLNLQFFLFLLR